MRAELTDTSPDLTQFLGWAKGTEAHDRNGGAQPERQGQGRALIVEKSEALARLMANGLATETLVIDLAHDTETSKQLIAKQAYSLILLDLQDLHSDGHGFLQHVHVEQPAARILVIDDRTGVDQLSALDSFAGDDWLVKPFSLLDLAAKVSALGAGSRISLVRAPKELSGFVLKRDELCVLRYGRRVDLTFRELALLECFMVNSGKTLSRTIIMQKVWKVFDDRSTNVVDVYVKYLRDKLDIKGHATAIRTVRGLGYVFSGD